MRLLSPERTGGDIEFFELLMEPQCPFGFGQKLVGFNRTSRGVQNASVRQAEVSGDVSTVLLDGRSVRADFKVSDLSESADEIVVEETGCCGVGQSTCSELLGIVSCEGFLGEVARNVHLEDRTLSTRCDFVGRLDVLDPLDTCPECLALLSLLTSRSKHAGNAESSRARAGAWLTASRHAIRRKYLQGAASLETGCDDRYVSRAAIALVTNRIGLDGRSISRFRDI